MESALWKLEENAIRSHTTEKLRDFTVDSEGDFFVYVLECESEVNLQREIEDYDGQKIEETLEDGENAWINYPATIRPPIGDHHSNFPKWVEQAVEADEVYYVGQTSDPVDRIAAHATASDRSAYASRLFPPVSITHIERVQSRNRAQALEDTIAQFISFGCEIESENYSGYGKVPEEIHSRLKRFANPDGPNLEIANGRNLAAFHSAPDNRWTTALLYKLTEIPDPIAPWDTHKEYDGFPIEKSIVVDWYLKSLEFIAEHATSFQYQEDLLLSQIVEFEEWLEASESYPQRGDPEEEYWNADEGIESIEEGKEYFEQLKEIGQKLVVEPFLIEYRKKTRELHSEPLRFAYSEKTPNIEANSGSDSAPNQSPSTKPTPNQESVSLSGEERKRLKDVIQMSPTSNGELQDHWNLQESADVYYYLEDHFSEWYYRDSDSMIRAADDAEDQI
ncbi:DUF5797 family protein [Haloplanus rubicundus]|uniref:DUF5797 family protein n=1 Tax=Haloplanus rubicundus TaxID=1547898 RepID=UPI00130044DC|nr:DUF5797 family protein [Haloplanus rubicundus]